jgi:hypothetical protein
MISRSTLVGALVVTELVIVAAAARAVSGGGPAYAPGPMSGTHTHFGFVFRNPGGHAVTSTVDRSFAAGLTPHVIVDVSDVPVTVQTAGLPVVHVLGTVRKSGFRDSEDGSITVAQTADGVRVTASDTSHVRGSFERTLRLTVPPGALVEIASGGAVEASGLRAKLIVHVDGAIRVSNHRGDLDVTTASGDVNLVDVQAGAIGAHTEEGDVKLTSVGADHFDVHTESGKIAATDLRAVDGALTTADGAIGVTFAAGSDANVHVHTDDGDITGAGPAPQTTASAETRTMRLGSARGSFTVSTDSGSITISSQGETV